MTSVYISAFPAGRRRRLVVLGFLCGLAGGTVSNQAAAVDWRFNGYGTVAGTATDEDNAEYRLELTQFEGATSEVDWGLRSKLGAQLTAEFGPEWSLTGQALAKRRGDRDMDPELEWFYAGYRPVSWFDFRVGRLVLPVFMLSDSRPVGFSQPFVEPPGHVYIDGSLEQFDGAQLINRFSIGGGALSVQTSVGSADVELMAASGFPPVEAEVNDLANLNIIYEWRNWLFRAGIQQADVEPTVLTPYFPPIEDEFSGIGVQYDNGTLLVMAEQVERDTEPTVSLSTSRYILVGWRFGRWLPSVTVAESDQELPTPFSDGESTAFTLRYDVSNSMAVKAQWEEVAPDTGRWLNADPAFLTGDDRNVYTLSVDFLF